MSSKSFKCVSLKFMVDYLKNVIGKKIIDGDAVDVSVIDVKGVQS